MIRILKFLVSGGIGISVNLGVFHLLYVSGTPYLLGSAIGFSVAMFVGFILQKYWTFDDRSSQTLRTQFALYATISVGNLALNTGIVYILIGHLETHYLLAQAIGAAVIAVESYLAYHFFIFNAPSDSSESPGLRL